MGGGWEDFGPKFAQVNITTDSFLGHYPHLYFIMLLGYVSTSEAHEHDHPSLVDVARSNAYMGYAISQGWQPDWRRSR